MFLPSFAMLKTTETYSPQTFLFTAAVVSSSRSDLLKLSFAHYALRACDHWRPFFFMLKNGKISVGLWNPFASLMLPLYHCSQVLIQVHHLLRNTFNSFFVDFEQNFCLWYGKVECRSMANPSRGRLRLSGSVRQIRLRSLVFFVMECAEGLPWFWWNH